MFFNLQRRVYKTSASVFTCAAVDGHVQSSYQGGNIVCKANTCNCDDGDRATGPACTKDGAYICDGSCYTGYHPEGTACKQNQCKCPANGNGAVGSSCPAQGSPQCGACNAYFKLQGPNCVIKPSTYYPTSGGWGGLCNCPDGKQEYASDAGNACGSLACNGV